MPLIRTLLVLAMLVTLSDHLRSRPERNLFCELWENDSTPGWYRAGVSRETFCDPRTVAT